MRFPWPSILPLGATAVALAAAWPASADPRPAPMSWRAPVDGDLLRPFHAGPDPFARGGHRGIDLAARPGAPVRATCSGRVAFAGVVAGSRVVTVTCGRWRVTHLPLRAASVTPGAHVLRGARIGSVGAGGGHSGLHVGVRRAGRRFGYVDPWPLLARAPVGEPPVVVPASRPVRVRPRAIRRPPRPRAIRPRVPAPHAVGEPVPAPDTTVGPAQADALAPPLAWLGLALLLAGVVRSRRRAPTEGRETHATRPATATARTRSIPSGSAGSPPRPAPGSASGRL